ncbi:MAG: YggT family protein [Clostridia bacterium]|jgi:YggT family protein|nr:YggT family protein [Clostridia bacterium]
MIFLFDLVEIAFNVMYWLIIIRVLLSWIRHDPYNPIFRFIYESTELVLGPIRRYLPLVFMGIDFSPIVAIFLLQALESLVFRLLVNIIF